MQLLIFFLLPFLCNKLVQDLLYFIIINSFVDVHVLVTVSSDDEVLSKARKEVKNEKVHFFWTQFLELNLYYKRQAEDIEKLNGKVAEMISLLTCHKKSTGKKGIRYSMTSELKGILTRMDARIQSLYSDLSNNAMFIVCTGHGDTAIVQRLRKMVTEEKETTMCHEKLMKPDCKSNVPLNLHCYGRSTNGSDIHAQNLTQKNYL